jgi:dihydrofolate reductase
MQKLISFMHISLDGYVCGINGEIDWIKFDQELFDHVGVRIAKTEAALYGRKTFDLMQGYWPTAGQQPNATKHDIEHSQWYSKAHKIVLSTSLNGKVLENTTILNKDFDTKLKDIKQQAGTEILVFGSPTATHALLAEHLIDGFWLFVNPVVLGEGVPLFTDTKDKMNLKLIGTRQFNCGVVELNYSAEHN